ncbi:hypothetical protein F01_450030 [Burkholderia cenocepacia]|nr:hypothetical protein F01_450030 [Burkholderia cenocepacia]
MPCVGDALRSEDTKNRSQVVPAARAAPYPRMRMSDTERRACAARAAAQTIRMRPARARLATRLGHGRRVGFGSRAERRGEPLQRENRPHDALILFAADLPVERDEQPGLAGEREQGVEIVGRTVAGRRGPGGQGARVARRAPLAVPARQVAMCHDWSPARNPACRLDGQLSDVPV